MGFCHLYFKIATALGGFQELGRMYFDIMRNSMFDDDRGNKVKVRSNSPDWFLRTRIYNIPSSYTW